MTVSGDELLVSQCAELRPGPLCELDADDRALTVWWKRSLGAPTFATDRGKPALLEHEATESGTLERLEIPAHSTLLTVTFESGVERRPWQLKLTQRSRVDALAEARALRREGRAADAAELLDRALANAAGASRWDLLSLRGRIFLDQGRSAEAVDTLQQSMIGLEAVGLRSHAARDAFALAFALVSREHDPEHASAVLARVRRWSERPPELEANLRYYEGLIAKQSADLRGAITAFRLARAAAEKTRSDVARFAQRELAKVLVSVGRTNEALVIQREILKSRLGARCEASDAHVDFALAVVALLERGQTPSPALTPAEQPLALLQRAEELLGPCSDPWRRRNIVIERLLRALDRGDLSEAHALLGRLEASSYGRVPLLDTWEYEARGVLALREAQPAAALAWFERQATVARRNILREESFRADVGLGNALLASGASEPALRAYRSAESVLDELLLDVPFGMGIHGFAAMHRRSATDLIRALVDLRMPHEAAEAARKARVRSLLRSAQPHRLSTLSEPARERWRAAIGRYEQLRAEGDALADDAVPLDELAALQRKRAAHALALRAALDAALLVLSQENIEHRPCFPAPRHGELRLLYHRDGGAYLGFALSSAGVTARQLGPRPASADLAVLGRYFLGPFAAEIAAAQELAFLLPDELWSIEFHRLDYEGRPLLARAPVSYAVDLCRPGESAPPRGPQRHALLVADALGDLPQSREEAATVAALITPETDRLSVLAGELADDARVRRELEEAWLFHYAGHGRHAGVEGYDSALPLASQTQLSLADLLTLASPPRRAVLSACEGAKLAEEGGISLAHAFVAAGSEAVVAALNPVSDAAAKELAIALYQHGGARAEVSLPHALRAAQLGLPADSQGLSFRVIVP
jgi:tetratricopeptide (TPR) repeat protein